MTQSILLAVAGGALIGLAASVMLVSVGRIAGISGIVGGLLKPAAGDVAWRAIFFGGLLAGGVLVAAVAPSVIRAPTSRSLWAVAVAGLLVGVGTRMGNGCTSGHGVCGLARFSTRSLVATVSFLVAAVVTATTIRLISGGVL